MAATLAAMTIAVTPALAIDQGDWLVRMRGIGVFPTSDSDGIAPDLTDGSVEAQRAVTPELDITYMATENVGLELILRAARPDVLGPRRAWFDGQPGVAGEYPAVRLVIVVRHKHPASESWPFEQRCRKARKGAKL